MELRRKWNSSPPRRFDQEDLDQVRVNPNLDSDEDSPKEIRVSISCKKIHVGVRRG